MLTSLAHHLFLEQHTLRGRGIGKGPRPLKDIGESAAVGVDAEGLSHARGHGVTSRYCGSAAIPRRPARALPQELAG